MTVPDRVKGPDAGAGVHPIRLSAVEFSALLERQSVAVALEGGEYYFFTIDPVTFWVPSREWEMHNLRGILYNCQAKWKDVLTEPTLAKLRALLNPPKEEPVTEPGREAR